MTATPLDPTFYVPPYGWGKQWRPRPHNVVGWTFDPTKRLCDFSAVPGFELGRVISIVHLASKTALYARPRPQDYHLKAAAVDGVPVLPQPTTGTVLEVSVDTSAFAATDEFYVTYEVDIPDNYFELLSPYDRGISNIRPPA